MKKKFLTLLVYIVCFFVFGWFVLKISQPKMHKKTYSSSVFSFQTDSLLLDERHCGDINLQKFIELASQKDVSIFNVSRDVVRTNDSITFSTSLRSIFFGQEGGAKWKNKYKNLPVSFPDDHSFRAVVHTIDGVEYIYIPFQILSCLASSFNEEPQNKDNNTINNIDTSDDITITIDDVKNIKTDGALIQTGGIVFQHVADVLQNNGGKNLSNRQQLELLWKYANDNWVYMKDPYTGTDTWRSASETIDAYYFTNKKGYSGDCDDFAILMASFARQLGFDSHIVTAFNDDKGHAYAEFKDGNKWVPMDWFSDKFGGRPWEATRRVVIEDI